MCEPTTLLMAASMVAQQQASSAAASATRQVAYNKAKQIEYQRKQTVHRGELRQQKVFQANADRSSKAMVALSASGIDAGAGSSNDVLADIASEGAMDSMIIKADIEGELHGLASQQQSVLTQGTLDSNNIRNNATSSLLTSGAQTAHYYKNR